MRHVPIARVTFRHHARLLVVPWQSLDEHHLLWCDHDHQCVHCILGNESLRVHHHIPRQRTDARWDICTSVLGRL